jgi:hypothetical protein
MEPHPKPAHVSPRESKRARGASVDAADATDDTRPEQSILEWARAAAMDAVYNFGVVAGQTVDTMSAAATAAWARAACARAHGDEDDNEDDDDDLIHAEEWEAGDIHSECGHCADGVGGCGCDDDETVDGCHLAGHTCTLPPQWALDDDGDSVSSPHVGTSHQGKGGGNPNPGLARKGGDGARLAKLTRTFADDLFHPMGCDGYLAAVGEDGKKKSGSSPFRQCPLGGQCCSRLATALHGDNLSAFRDEVELERSSMFAMSRAERLEVVMQVVAVERNLPRASAHVVGQRTAPAHIRGQPVCVAAWAFYHGVSGAAYKKACAALSDEEQLVDGRTLNRGTRGEGRINIIIWCNKTLPDWGSWMPAVKRASEDPDRELKMTLVSPERDL